MISHRSLLWALITATNLPSVHASRWPRYRVWQEDLASPTLIDSNDHGNSSSQLLVAHELGVRQAGDKQSTCGFAGGDISKPRTAQPGFDCRIDTIHGLWGFCPTTVISATDCGLAGACVDSHACTSGCGQLGVSGLTTFSCATAQFCSTVLLTSSVSVFSYIACGPGPSTDQLNIVGTTVPPTPAPTPVAATPTPTATPSAAASTTSAPQPSTTPTTPPSGIAKTAGSSSSSNSPGGTTSPAVLPKSSHTSVFVNGGASTGGLDSNSGSGPSATTSSNLGPIIGGILGGLALIVILILGIMFLRRWNRNHSVDDPSGTRKNRGSRATWWGRPYRTTDMQTDGLHEKEGDIPRQQYEKEGCIPARYEKEADVPPQVPRKPVYPNSPVELP